MGPPDSKKSSILFLTEFYFHAIVYLHKCIIISKLASKVEPHWSKLCSFC